MTKKSNDKKDVSVKKMIFEIVAISLCIIYLYYSLLWNQPKVSIAILYIVTLITCGELLAKYISEVYIYESKNNIIKILVIILSILLIILLVTYIFIRTKIIKIALLVSLLIMSCYLLYLAIKNIINISKDKKNYSKYVIASYLSLLSFSMIIMGTIISLIK